LVGKLDTPHLPLKMAERGYIIIYPSP